MLRVHYSLLIWVLFANGCAAVQSISELALQEKLARIKLGLTTKEEIENLFGKEHTAERSSWSYNLSDTAVAISQSPRNGWGGLVPVSVATERTNTRALINVRFNENHTVRSLEVQRFFNIPFTSDYFYFSDHDKDLLDLAARAGEMSHFRVTGFDQTTGKLVLLETDANYAQIMVEFNKPILHIKTINPYDRLSNEYRVFTKRETQFIETICAQNCRRKVD
jgi:hypothetical protein